MHHNQQIIFHSEISMNVPYWIDCLILLSKLNWTSLNQPVSDKAKSLEASNSKDIIYVYQPSTAWGTRSPSATPHCLKHLTACLILNDPQSLEIGQTLVY